MQQASQQEGFALEGICSLGDFLGCEPTLAHLLYGNDAITKFVIFGLVDCAKATFPYLSNHVIALPDQGVRNNLLSGGGVIWQRLATDEAISCLQPVGCATC